jgi:iron complex outermembrane recepter protein
VRSRINLPDVGPPRLEHAGAQPADTGRILSRLMLRRGTGRTTARWVCAVVVLFALPGQALGQQREQGQPLAVQDLKRLSIEELAELDVTTAARRVQRLSEAAAAVSVVRGEDVRRSGYSTLADALRLADGVDVARTSGNNWAISARGFNIASANKMLVLMDGRTVYSPLTGGTFWDVQQTFLQDLDRIEVVRGPGGATWGANAVNGVINIVTREAAATRGTLAVLTTGTSELVTLGARHGGRMGEAGSYRVYTRYRRRAGELFATGERAGNGVQHGQAGFRLDSTVTGATRWTLLGDVSTGRQEYPDRPEGRTSGANLLGRWTRVFSAASSVQLQAYYDRTTRDIPLQFRETRDTWDVDAQHTRRAGRHHLVWGAGFRVSHGDDVGDPRAGSFFEPEEKTDGLFNVFVQDEITLRPDRLFLTLGAKVERNDFTGFEHQPTARLRWSSGGTQSIWGAVSRAVRLPTRLDTDLVIIDRVTGATTLRGDRAIAAEKVIAYEAGYRVRPREFLSIDVATFTNRYDDLRSTDVIDAVIVLRNRLNAVTSGVEAGATVQAAPPWQVHGSYTYLYKRLSFDEGGPDFYGGTVEGNDPAHQFAVRSYLDLPRGFALDSVIRHRSTRPALLTPAHTEWVQRIGWVSPRLELSLVGQDLLRAHNPEFYAGARPIAIRRGVYLRSVWRF